MKKISDNIMVKLALVVFSLFCVFTIITHQFQNNDLKAQVEDRLDQLEEAEARLQELQRKNDEPFDDEYIIEYAKENLNYRHPEEVVFYTGN